MSERYKALESGAPYFITLTLVKWLPIFKLPAVSDIVINSLKFCQEKKGLKIFGYCIMPSHIHLIARTDDMAIGYIIRDFKKYTAFRIAEATENDKSLRKYYRVFLETATTTGRNKQVKVWLDGYHPEVINSSKFFYQKLNYIHHNPVEAHLVERAEDYYLSSARNYAELDAPLVIVLETRELLSY